MCLLDKQLQEEKEDVQRKIIILQDDLEKSEARADEYRKVAEEKASSLDETERSVQTCNLLTLEIVYFMCSTFASSSRIIMGISWCRT